MKKCIIIAITILVVSAAQAQITFERTYGAAEYSETGSRGQQTADGGYILAGDSGPMSTQEIYLVKTDSLGNKQWTKTMEDSYLIDVLQTADGGYVLLIERSWQKRSLIKLDSTGNMVWEKVMDELHPHTINQTAGDEFIFTGYVMIDTLAVGKLIKTNANGDTLWTKTLNPQMGIKTIELTADGGYVVSGPVWDVSSGDSMYHAFLAKLDSAGGVQWMRTYGEDSIVSNFDARQTIEGGYVLCGWTDTTLSTGYLTTLAYIIRTDSMGDTLWTMRMPFMSGANSIRQTGDGNFVIAGDMHPFGTNDQFFLCKVDDAGNILWLKTYGGITDVDHCRTMQLTSDGGFMLLGYTFPPDIDAHTDFFLVKTDADGYTSEHSGIIAHPVLTAHSFPNPFSNATTITVANTISPLSIAVFDITGKQKDVEASVVNMKGNTQFYIRRGNLPAGVYLYQVISNKAAIASGKLVID